jgi:hypothetical protein
MTFSGSEQPPLKVIVPDATFAGFTDLNVFFCSLNCEHIARDASSLVAPGVPRNILPPSTRRSSPLASLHRWFFQRRPDSGFILSGFPATLTEAMVLDEWLEARGETLDVCLFPADVSTPALTGVVRHYTLQGVAWHSTPNQVLPPWIQPALVP